MDYPDGQRVRVGDKIKLSGECRGIVVCSIDDDQYTTEYPKAEWSYLERGVLIVTDKMGLLHLTKPEEDLELLERQPT